MLTIDYRGFGHSTGSPTEAGLIADGTALVDWAMHVANIPPERIVLLGQSLGTAVSSAVALNFADPSSELIPRLESESSVLLSSRTMINPPTAFAGVILVAPFYSLPSLLLTYRLGGLIPLLSPLRPFPSIGSALTSQMIDSWQSGKRLAAYERALAASPKLLKHRTDDFSGDGSGATREMGMLQVIHAKSDMDISYHQTEMICNEIMGDEERCIAGSDGLLLDARDTNKMRLRVQILEHGGQCPLPESQMFRLTHQLRTQPYRDILSRSYCGGQSFRRRFSLAVNWTFQMYSREEFAAHVPSATRSRPFHQGIRCTEPLARHIEKACLPSRTVTIPSMEIAQPVRGRNQTLSVYFVYQ